MVSSNNWTETTLGKEVDLITGFPFKSKNYTDSSDSVKLLRGDNIAQGVLRWENAKLWPHEQLDDLTEYQLKEDDVVLAMDRPWIEAGLKYACIRDTDLPAILVQRVARLRGGERLQTRFIYYLIGSYNFTNYVLSIQTGTAVPHISSQQIRDFPFLLPSLDEQKKIVQILASLDDKIELNRQMNQTLEAMAQSIFQSWFVDFEPVKAKQKAKAAGKSAAEIEMAAIVALSGKSEEAIGELSAEVRSGFGEIAGLFSDELVESELGLLPKGWDVGKLKEITDILNGCAFKSEDYINSGIFVLRTRNFDANGLASRREDDVFLSEDFLESYSQYVCQKFDFHLVMVGASVGKTSLLLPHLLPALRNQNMWCFRPKHAFPSKFLLNYIVESKVKEVMGWASGSARSFFRKSDFDNHKVIVPGTRITHAFENFVEPLFYRISLNASEIETLAELRDSLLPKLLSGELTLPAAQTQVTEALVP